jgi:cytosine/adenosine deaminase-related metal-dependent hydrolase
MITLNGCHVLTVNAAGDEFGAGHVVVDGGRIVAVGPGSAPAELSGAPGARVIDATGCLATPGLVNTHHHLYQWASRGLAADATLLRWLAQLYPVWAGLDGEIVGAAATAALAWLAKSGCSTTMDHHYVFPRVVPEARKASIVPEARKASIVPEARKASIAGGDLLAATVAAARAVGLRFHMTRGSMDLGISSGGLPPDEVVEDRDEILAATQAVIETYHDPAPGSMRRVAIAPCSPFTASPELMAESAALARRLGVRLHTHLAETADEVSYCRERFGATPAEYAESLGWLGDDVWLAHGIHFSDAEIGRLAATGTGVAHCPSSNARLGAGICRVAELLKAGVPVGLGVDGAASNEACSLLEEVRQALLFARASGGPEAMSVRRAVQLGTIGGARLLGRADEIGSLEAGKLADVALWRIDGLGHAGIADPVAALVLGPLAPLELLLVGGRPVVEHGGLLTVDEEEAAAAASRAAAALARKAGAS